MAIRTTVSSLSDSIIELTGMKSGIALTKSEAIEHLKIGYSDSGKNYAYAWWQLPYDTNFRIRIEQVEDDFLLLMNQIGAIPDVRSSTELLIDWMKETGELQPVSPHTPLDRELFVRLNRLHSEIASGDTPPDMEDIAREMRRRNIMVRSFPDVKQWNGLIPLQHLFDSEEVHANAIPSQHFDQRFIDYLSTQEGKLESIQWREFEYLCAEFFQRAGYQVTITPARGDGGIDLYADKLQDFPGPEQIIVQSKRLSGKNEVSINDVKALWADLEEEKATRAVIATTTRLAVGARSFCEARKYRITHAESDDVKKWLNHMKTHQ